MCDTPIVTIEELIGSKVQKVESVLVKPGWSALRQVSFTLKFTLTDFLEQQKLCEMLRSLPDKYLSHESVTFNFSVIYFQNSKVNLK